MEITLRAARVNAGLTLKEAAGMLNTSYQTLWNVEQGKSKMSVEKFKMLCEIYGVSPNDLKVHLSSQIVAEV